MLHEKFKPPTSRQQPSSESVAFKQSLAEVAEQNKELQPHISKAQVWGEGWIADTVEPPYNRYIETTFVLYGEVALSSEVIMY